MRKPKSPNGHYLDCECPKCDQYGAPWRRKPQEPHPMTTTPTETGELLAALEKCRDQFRFYADEHVKAEKWAKAETNAAFAVMADEAIQAYRTRTAAPVGEGSWRPISELPETEDTILIWDEEASAPCVWSAMTYFSAVNSEKPHMHHLREQARFAKWWMLTPRGPYPHPATQPPSAREEAPPQPGLSAEVRERLERATLWPCKIVESVVMCEVQEADLSRALAHIDALEARAQAAERRLEGVRVALTRLAKDGEGCCDTGWEMYSDGYAAARIEDAKTVRAILALLAGGEK